MAGIIKLHELIAKGGPNLAKRVEDALIQNGIDNLWSTQRPRIQHTILQTAAEYGHVDVMKIILWHCYRPRCRVTGEPTTDEDLSIVLGWDGPALLERLEKIERYEEHEPIPWNVMDDLRMVDRYQTSCFHLAAMNGHLEVIQFLVSMGAGGMIEHTSPDGKKESMFFFDTYSQHGDWTPLHLAAFHGHIDIVVLLLQLGSIRLFCRNQMYEPRTPIEMAIENNSQPKKHHNSQIELTPQNRSQNYMMVEAMLKHSIYPIGIDNWNSCLHMCIREKDLVMIHILLRGSLFHTSPPYHPFHPLPFYFPPRHMKKFVLTRRNIYAIMNHGTVEITKLLLRICEVRNYKDIGDYDLLEDLRKRDRYSNQKMWLEQKQKLKRIEMILLHGLIIDIEKCPSYTRRKIGKIIVTNETKRAFQMKLFFHSSLTERLLIFA